MTGRKRNGLGDYSLGLISLQVEVEETIKQNHKRIDKWWQESASTSLSVCYESRKEAVIMANYCRQFFGSIIQTEIQEIEDGGGAHLLTVEK